MVSSILFLFDSLACPVQKLERLWQMSEDYCKLNQTVVPIPVVIVDLTLLPEHINKTPGTWYVTTDVANASFSVLIMKANQE